SVVCGLVGAVLLTLGIAMKLPVPFCIWGFISLVVALVARRNIGQLMELWVHGTEMLAEAKPGKAWTLTVRVDGRPYQVQTAQLPLLWVNDRVRVLVDLDRPTRMMPVRPEMVEVPEAEEPPPVLPPVLPPRPRRANLLVLTEARQRRTAAAVTAVIAL